MAHTVYQLVPAGTTDTYAAGIDGNWFASESAAESAAEDLDGDWEVVESEIEPGTREWCQAEGAGAVVSRPDGRVLQRLRNERAASARVWYEAMCDTSTPRSEEQRQNIEGNYANALRSLAELFLAPGNVERARAMVESEVGS